MSDHGSGPDDPWQTPPQQGPAPQYPSAPQYGYGYPGGPGGPGGPVDRGPLPASVHWASILIITRTVLSVIGTVVLLTQLNDIVDRAVARSRSSADPETVRNLARITAVIGAGIGLVIAVVLVWVALQLRQGKNWARITAIVLAALGIVGGLLSYVRSYSGLATTLNTIQLLLSVAVLVLLVQPASNRYFSPRPY